MSRLLRRLPSLTRAHANKLSVLQPQSRLARHFASAATPDVIRNVAIVAHVDHGKTTLVDQLLKHGGNKLSEDRVMDSIDLERERGITIMSKCTRVEYGGHVLNIVDTPGHQDFGGEVERILSMVDGVVLVVDATEGPMSQTKFVLTKALNRGLKPLVVINKVDRETSRLNGEVENELFDMFVALEANDDQLEFPVLYASAKQGWAVRDLDDPEEAKTDMKALLDQIIAYVPSPQADPSAPFSMAVTMIGHDPYVGRLATGRITSGSIKIGDPIQVLNLESQKLETGKVTKLFVTKGVARSEVDSATAGDIVTVAGVQAFVSDTICNPTVTEPLPSPQLDPPTISMTFGVNDSPIAGKEGKFLTSSHIKDRLQRECENNVAISVSNSESSEAFNVHGRGELQLAILIENMRREGFEMCVSAPQVLFKNCAETNQKLEPIEEVTIDVDADFSGSVIDKLSNRGGEIIEFKEMQDKVRLQFKIPSRCLMGYRSEIKTDTRGSGVLNSIFHGYAPYHGSASAPTKGKLISSANGVATAYALNGLEDRGELFVKPGEEVYTGMVVGEHSRPNDLEVNPTKEKKLTNMRAAGSDENIRLAPARVMSLEDIVTYIGEDEMIDVTPSKIRMRKRELSSNARRRSDEAQYNMLAMKLQRDINCLSDPERGVRRRASDKLFRALQAEAHQLSPAVLQELCSANMKSVLLRVAGSDAVEKCREKAIAMLLFFVEREALERSSAVLHEIVELLNNRLGKLPYPEPTEEIRLQLLQLLCSYLRQLANLDERMSLRDEITPLANVLGKAAVDPFPDVKKLTADTSIVLARSWRHDVALQLGSVVKPMASNLGHQHSRVRVSALQALEALVPCGSEALPELMKDVLVPAANKALFDNAASVRRQLVVTIATWLREIEHVAPYHASLLPLLLGGAIDEAPDVQDAFRISISDLALKWAAPIGGDDDHNEDIEMEDDHEDRKPPLYFTSRLPLALRRVAKRSARDVLPQLLEKTTDWTVHVRARYAKILGAFLTLLEGSMSAFLDKVFAVLAKICRDDEEVVTQSVKECLTVVGYYADPTTILASLLPMVAGRMAGQDTAQHRTNGLVLLGMSVRGMTTQTVASHLQEILDALCESGVRESEAVDLQEQLAMVVLSVIKAAGPALAGSEDASFRLFWLISHLLAAAPEDSLVSDTPCLFEAAPQMLPVLKSCLDDSDSKTRQLVCLALQYLFVALPGCLGEEPVHQLYAEILKRLDDSNDTVRRAACQTFKTFLRAAPKSHFKGTIIDYTLDCLFVHLDDSDPTIQEAVADVIVQTVDIDAPLLAKKAQENRSRHHNPTFCDQILTVANSHMQ
ncbi:hypothetical protein P43SY_009809 [Pythium insidiosum]|uniref:Tr-type G domain-containing protein n=1 Tax=Pythium insidiosum TaxID=114742 RepID=A0AAD5M3V8_PYTIN|nr:hypothetical protein P43SY_009809 [Pythium insidiosum]